MWIMLIIQQVWWHKVTIIFNNNKTLNVIKRKRFFQTYNSELTIPIFMFFLFIICPLLSPNNKTIVHMEK